MSQPRLLPQHVATKSCDIESTSTSTSHQQPTRRPSRSSSQCGGGSTYWSSGRQGYDDDQEKKSHIAISSREDLHQKRERQEPAGPSQKQLQHQLLPSCYYSRYFHFSMGGRRGRVTMAIVCALLCLAAIVDYLVCQRRIIGKMVVDKNNNDLLAYSSSSSTTTTPRAGDGNNSGRSTATTIKPFAVIHVGPHKTGSTSIQHFIFNELKLLRKDNYVVPVVPGGWQHKNSAHLAACFCFNNETTTTRSEETLGLCPQNERARIIQTFAKFIDKTAALNNNENNNSTAVKTIRRPTTTNILISSEEFDRPEMDIAALKSMLEPRFEVRIVIYYRRFYDWIASYHNELAKEQQLGGYSVTTPFVEWLTIDRMNDKSEQHAFQLYKRYSSYFPSESAVEVIDIGQLMSNNISLEESFFCKGVPNTRHVCNHIRQRARSPKKKNGGNPSVPIGFYELMTALLGRYPNTTATNNKNLRPTIEKRWKQLLLLEEKEYHNRNTSTTAGDDSNTPNIIARRCLPQTVQDKLLEMSQLFELGINDVIPYSSSNNNELTLEQDFRKKVVDSSKTFCSVDTKLILDSWEGEDWFRALLKEKKSSWLKKFIYLFI